MSKSDHLDDDQLMDELGRGLDDHEPLPEHVAAAAADAAFRLHRADDVLAELVADTAGDEVGSSAMRGDDGERVVTYEAAGRTIEVRLGLEPGTAVGRVAPSDGVQVSLETADGTIDVDLDTAGWFRFICETGTLRLVVRELNASTEVGRIVTPWLFV